MGLGETSDKTGTVNCNSNCNVPVDPQAISTLPNRGPFFLPSSPPPSLPPTLAPFNFLSPPPHTHIHEPVCTTSSTVHTRSQLISLLCNSPCTPHDLPCSR